MDLDADIDIRSRKLFDDADLDLGLEARILDLASNALGPAVTPGDARTQHRQYLRVSGMERAILETLEEIPRTVSFEHGRSEEHTSELQSLMRISYAVFC